MPQVVIVENENAKYSENLFPYKSTLNEAVNLTVTDGIVNATVEIVDSNVPLYNRLKSVRAIFTDTDVCTFNLGDALSFTAPFTGNYIMTMRVFIPSTYSSATIYGKLVAFVNSSLFNFDYSSQNEQFVHGQWNTFSQIIEMNQGDEFIHAIKVQSDVVGSRIYYGGFDIKFDDRGLQGIPPFYSEPHNPKIGLIVNKTTAEIEAIATPFEGEQYYNTTLHTICFYDGTQWKKVSHTTM